MGTPKGTPTEPKGDPMHLKCNKTETNQTQTDSNVTKTGGFPDSGLRGDFTAPVVASNRGDVGALMLRPAFLAHGQNLSPTPWAKIV